VVARANVLEISGCLTISLLTAIELVVRPYRRSSFRTSEMQLGRVFSLLQRRWRSSNELDEVLLPNGNNIIAFLPYSHTAV